MWQVVGLDDDRHFKVGVRVRTVVGLDVEWLEAVKVRFDVCILGHMHCVIGKE